MRQELLTSSQNLEELGEAVETSCGTIETSLSETDCRILESQTTLVLEAAGEGPEMQELVTPEGSGIRDMKSSITESAISAHNPEGYADVGEVRKPLRFASKPKIFWCFECPQCLGKGPMYCMRLLKSGGPQSRSLCKFFKVPISLVGFEDKAPA